MIGAVGAAESEARNDDMPVVAVDDDVDIAATGVDAAVDCILSNERSSNGTLESDVVDDAAGATALRSMSEDEELDVDIVVAAVVVGTVAVVDVDEGATPLREREKQKKKTNKQT